MSRTPLPEPPVATAPADRMSGVGMRAAGPLAESVAKATPMPQMDKAARERARKARAIVKACAHIFADAPDPAAQDDLLYDELGLPR